MRSPGLTHIAEPLLCSFQSPVEIPGVSNIDFLRVATNARRKALGQPELDPLEFYAFVMPKVRWSMCYGCGHRTFSRVEWSE